MLKKAQNKQSKTPKRWEFNNISDILVFESEMLHEGMTLKEKARFEKSFCMPDGTSYIPPEYPQGRFTLKNVYYLPKDKKYILVESKKDARDLLLNKGAIPASQVLSADNKIAKETTSLNPIIFEKKGTTPPSVPYLKVKVTSDIKGDLTSLHQVHTKTKSASK